ncbi:MAG: serine/threonine protein kinase [Deltaproteobacteria bacterium]|nr:MAG: serine/threonine protein kinase [Deltaproteobacteria bacterium]
MSRARTSAAPSSRSRPRCPYKVCRPALRAWQDPTRSPPAAGTPSTTAREDPASPSTRSEAAPPTPRARAPSHWSATWSKGDAEAHATCYAPGSPRPERIRPRNGDVVPKTRYCTRCLSTFESDPERCANLACGAKRPKTGWSTMLESGDILDRHYRIEQTLALGGAGLAYRARELDANGDPHGPDLAIKVLYAQRDQGSFLQRLSNEAQILQQLNHPHIIECRGFVHRTGHAPYLVTLFEHGGNLGDMLDEHTVLPPRVAAGVLRQILLALDKAHERGIIHRDLKPENVLLRERVPPGEIPEVRVADFGIAKVEALGGKLTRQGAFVGTPEFAAPEQFEGLPLTPATDIYAAGALFYTLLTGQDLVVFEDRLDPYRCLEELCRALPPPAPANVGTPEERDLIQEILHGTLALDPLGRWSVRRVLRALEGLIDGDPAATLQGMRDNPLPDEAGAPILTGSESEDVGDLEDELYQPGSLSPALVGVGLPLVTLVLGLGLLVIALGGVAWASGWLASAPDPTSANQVATVHARAPSDTVTDLGSATDPAQVRERDRMLHELASAARHLPRSCGLSGPLAASIEVTSQGRIRALQTEGLEAAQQICVARVLRTQDLPRKSQGTVRLNLRLDLGG